MAVNLGEDGTLEKLGANTFYNILESSGGSSAGGAGVNDINDGLATTTLRAPNKLVNGNGGGGGGDMCIPGWTPSKELQADPAWPLGGGGIWNNRKAEFANHNFSYLLYKVDHRSGLWSALGQCLLFSSLRCRVGGSIDCKIQFGQTHTHTEGNSPDMTVQLGRINSNFSYCTASRCTP